MIGKLWENSAGSVLRNFEHVHFAMTLRQGIRELLQNIVSDGFAAKNFLNRLSVRPIEPRRVGIAPPALK